MKTTRAGGGIDELSGRLSGTLQGVTAYVIWGCFPLYFKTVTSVAAVEVLAHRIIWSAFFLILFVFLTGAVGQLGRTLRDGRTVAVLACTALLISTNWLVFIHAVNDGKVLHTSLGYYINPLVSILLASAFLRERLSPRQTLSIILAATGVVIQTVMVGSLPRVSLYLAFSFGFYGLIRKAVRVPALTGLTVEMLFITPLALFYMVSAMARGEAAFMAGGMGMNVLLIMAGVITATPLIMYGKALHRLRLSTLGVMQYILPTGHFTWAVFLFGETFTLAHMLTFGFIWAGLALYTYDSIGALRPATQAAGQVGEE